MSDKNYNYKNINRKRRSGIIMHISSLPSKYGIGTLGAEAYNFIDFLEKSSQKLWQILPIGPTSYGDSPYQSFSSFAGNSYFIDLDILRKEKYLKLSDYSDIDFGNDPKRVDYGKIYNNRYAILEIAYTNFMKKNKEKQEFDNFIKKEEYWLKDYALFMVIKEKSNGVEWSKWEVKYKNRDKKALDNICITLKEKIYFQYFIQYKFYQQYNNMKKYANDKGIKIIGDLPIYVAQDSADVWSNPELFLKDKVGGCPPDGFSDGGQLWGNPIYDWERNEKEEYKWWISRIAKNMESVDTLRIDHFRGFEEYWSVPLGDKDARNGKWVKGPGMSLFNKVKEVLGDIDIIAEDLGYTTKELVEFREETGFPGMKMLEFAFDLNQESDFLPHQMERNWVVYTSTHDSETVKQWFDKDTEEQEYAVKYLGLNKKEGYVYGFIRSAWASVCDTAIAQIQDFLELGEDSRMNIPSQLGNWTWRVEKKYLNKKLAEKISKITKLYYR